MPYDYSLEDVQLKFQAVYNSVADQTEATQDGIRVSSYCEQLTTLLTDNTDTMSSLGMESIRIALQAIYSNVGAAYSCESYAESHFRQHALEDLLGFVKELWTRVKTSIQTLWDKVSQFWEDNFSALQSVRKHLQHAMVVVQQEYKVNSSKQSLRISDTVLNAFCTKKDVDDVIVSSFVMTHMSNFERLDEIINRTKYFNQHVKTISKETFERDVDSYLISITEKLTSRVFKFGLDVRPIIGGDYISVEYNFEPGSVDLKIDVNKTTLPSDLDRREIYTADQQKLKGIIKHTIDVIDETIRYAHIREQAQKEFDGLIHAYDKLIIEGDVAINKNVNKAIKLIYKINSCMPGFFSLVVLSNVKLAKSVMTYANLCMKEA